MTRDILAWRRRGRDVATPPPLLRWRSSSGFILGTICMAVFTDIFLYGVIVPVIPFALTRRVGVAEQDVQHWVSVLLAVYGAALLGTSPICGWLADRAPNRRLPLLIGLLALAGATTMLCLGTTLAIMIVGRILQGISAAIVWTVGLTLLVDTVGQASIGQMMGYVSISMSVAVLVGPLLGGVVYDKAGYYAVYCMCFGLVALDIILRLALIEKKVAKKWHPPASLAPDTAAFPTHTEKSTVDTPSNSPIPLDPISIPAPTQPLHLPISRSQPPSLAPPPTKRPYPAVLTLLASRRLLAALYTTLTQSILLTAWDAILPLYTARLFSFTSTGAGLIFLPLILPSFLAPLFGHWADKRGPRPPVLAGFLLAIPPLVCLRYVTHPGTPHLVLLCALLATLGLALAMAMTPLLAEIAHVVASKTETHPRAFKDSSSGGGGGGAYATAYGLFNCAYAGGMLVGPLWGGFVLGTGGWGVVGWSLGCLSVGGALVGGVWVGGVVCGGGGGGGEDEEERVGGGDCVIRIG